MIITFFGHSNFDKGNLFEDEVLSLLNSKLMTEEVECYLGG